MAIAIIIGAGPAGLTAAYELLTRTNIKPILLEQDNQPGGISRTVNYKGNLIDIGGHRFFSRNDAILDWWLRFLPLDPHSPADVTLQYHNKEKELHASHMASSENEAVMLVRPRKSRIYYRKKFFDYPVQLNAQTIRQLGLLKITRIFFSYLWAKVFPQKPEENLAQFFRNRFGNELYDTFFKDYTEKVWGVPCEQIPATWGHQRVKDLSIAKTIQHALQSIFKPDKSLRQEKSSTSLIQQFLYPQRGPGQLWEAVAAKIIEKGGEIHYNTRVTELRAAPGNVIHQCTATHLTTGETSLWKGDYFFSTMPVKHLVNSLVNCPVPPPIKDLAANLPYRDFLIVGLLTRKLLNNEDQKLDDNWLYIQDKNVLAGRVQIFNNWSPHMVADSRNTWIGVEYFANESDAFWKEPDDKVIDKAVEEMQRIGILQKEHVLDGVVIRVPKAYPSYHGSYDRFNEIQEYLDQFSNLYLLGRNGMHRYNNMDHSMLTAMQAVQNIINNHTDKTNIWEINTEEAYHEQK